ncbi:YicC/YloC family endoribonuclease, partial [Escherichia coli]|uniref:YicC/YloC family endoribonuclease n=1 Tax=Escherichia coli TaxID=562 RepID=UPI00278C16A7
MTFLKKARAKRYLADIRQAFNFREMRSVNQRYLETYFRLPEQFRSLEPVVRERIRSRLTRGKVE